MLIDDLRSISDNSSTFKFADDLTIPHFVRSQSDDNIQLEFDHVLSWSKIRSLPINESKCRVLNITTKKSLQNPVIKGPDDCSLPKTLLSVCSVLRSAVIFNGVRTLNMC